MGQHIASLEYLLPTEYTSTLAVLHSKAPESDLDEIKAVFRNNLHKEVRKFPAKRYRILPRRDHLMQLSFSLTRYASDL